MRRPVRLLLLWALLPVTGTGCQVVSALYDFYHHEKEPPPQHDAAQPVPILPNTADCGRLALLPEHPLYAINLSESRTVALARGRVNNTSYSLQLHELWVKSVSVSEKQQKTDSLSTSRAMLQLTEDLVFNTERAYWNLFEAWWTLACQAAILEQAEAQERLTQRLLDEKQATQFELESARQSRLEAQADLLQGQTGENDRPGLFSAERQLRATLGLPADCPLLLPADCPLLDGPLPELAELEEQAQQYRLDLQQARATVQLARRRLERAKSKSELSARKNLELAEAARDDLCERIRLELVGARQRVELARQFYCLARQKRQSAARTVQARLASSREKVGGDALALIQARRSLVEAVRAEHLAAGACARALLDLERRAGVLLVRSGIRLPTPPRVNTPRAVAPPPEPLHLPAGLMPGGPPLLLRTELLTGYEGQSLMEWLAQLATPGH
jgi:outer membrane protein TolC